MFNQRLLDQTKICLICYSVHMKKLLTFLVCISNSTASPIFSSLICPPMYSEKWKKTSAVPSTCLINPKLSFIEQTTPCSLGEGTDSSRHTSRAFMLSVLKQLIRFIRLPTFAFLLVWLVWNPYCIGGQKSFNRSEKARTEAKMYDLSLWYC